SNPKYYNLLLRSIPYQREFIVRSKGIWISRLQLTDSSFFNIPLLCPPIDVQIQIARYLDYKNYQINKYIRIKKRQIDLLKELKQVVINDAVTGKIDVRTGKPYPKYKDSGVEWLGMIPEEWEVTRFRNVCYLQRGHDLSSDKFFEGDYPVMGSNGVIGFHNQYTTKAPNITIGRSGSTGKVNFIDVNFWAHNTALFVLHNFGNDWNWLYYFIANFDMAAVSEGSAVPTLNRNYIHRVHVAVPKRETQDKIHSYINRINENASGMIKIIEDKILLLKELQTRLISDVVTGKLDVRDIVVPDVPGDQLAEYIEQDENEIDDMVAEEGMDV
ncbi:MAG: restriction endonuclease subunit S, partial [Candidatus Cloacimonetes bacterium]|nr:restriction endonuclease subunit S [Candidatus Cloacimonadota bacterium]